MGIHCKRWSQQPNTQSHISLQKASQIQGINYAETFFPNSLYGISQNTHAECSTVWVAYEYQ